MSQNKTQVPGMNDAVNYTSSNGNDDFYARGARGSSHRGTVVPGVGGNTNFGHAAQQSQMQGNEPQSGNAARHSQPSGKPVVGFLYSISRQGIGEYWPLHIGQNTIGTSSSCDIQLAEGTVSSEHAVIVVRKMKKPEKTIASISDARSTNGTMVNGESLGFAPIECFDGDIITIGENYEFVILLIDVAGLGLKVAENFIPVDVERTNNPGPIFEDHNATRHGDVFPHFTPDPAPFYDSSSESNGGTVGVDGSRGFKNGGTVGM